jgi:isochorismate synthase
MPEIQAKSISENLEALLSNQVIERLAGWSTSKNLPFVIYRLPNNKHFNILIGSSVKKVKEENLAEVTSGFLFSTYEGEHYFIDNGMIYSSEDQQLKVSPSWPPTISLEKNSELTDHWQPYSLRNDTKETQPEEFINYVETCIAEINISDLIKVVPSRTKRINLNESNHLSDIFLKLCDNYENAFVSLLSTPNFGTWIGASPETLIEVDKEGVFRTMSLAGTQPFNKEQLLHTLPWTQKEIEEQAMVSRYIINRFKEIRLREFEEVGPRTVKAGNLAHLCSTFKVDTKATNFPDLGSVMLKLLHPTSAVCGMPKPEAQALLKSLEKHDRKLYSGYLGPVNMPEGSHIYVNLRCMEVIKDEAILYAGAGVTAYSIPQDEWYETELKCNTLLNIMKD